MSEEVWKAVVGFEGLYEVSSYGRVKSVERPLVYERVDQYSGKTLTVTRRHKSKLLRPAAGGSGKLSVFLGRGNGREVHILVIRAFIGPPPTERHECCHWDDDPFNNRAENLRWGTREENIQDRRRNGIENGRALDKVALEAKKLGLKRFSSAKPCKRGHISERYVKGRACVTCEKEKYLKRKITCGPVIL